MKTTILRKNQTTKKYNDTDPPRGMGYGHLASHSLLFCYNKYNEEILVFLCKIGDTSLQILGF